MFEWVYLNEWVITVDTSHLYLLSALIVYKINSIGYFFKGLCKVDETPKGWYIQYIDRDPETIRRQLELEKKKKQDLDDEEKTAKFIQEQVRRGLEGKEQVGIIQRCNRQRSEEAQSLICLCLEPHFVGESAWSGIKAQVVEWRQSWVTSWLHMLM